ncbi:MAG: M67 family metallopeptidase [Chloroflexi bacterium]|nr:M67 family metallopeptidase [Chloroflexota bacterium]
MPPLELLRIPANLWQTMHDHVVACLPEEACGLLAGRDGLVTLAIPVENAAHSPVRYRMEPRAQVGELLSIEARGLDLIGIYHSHPNGPAVPSATDLAEAYDPETLSLIWCSGRRGWSVRAFALRGGQPTEVTVEVLPAE